MLKFCNNSAESVICHLNTNIKSVIVKCTQLSTTIKFYYCQYKLFSVKHLVMETIYLVAVFDKVHLEKLII